ncbi:MAG: Presenilin [Promethearchaeota archaeon]|nr:MAG: Presenilin [Candidatus Lokiarchaeota archaeon]
MSEDEHDENSIESYPEEERASQEDSEEKEIIEKDTIPHFFPTYRINRKLYPIPIILAVVFAGILAYFSVIAGVKIEGGYFSEAEGGAAAGLLNGIIFTAMAVGSAFVMIYFVKKKGIGILKYVFGFSIGFITFFQTWFFAEIIMVVIFNLFPYTENLQLIYNIADYAILVPSIAILSIYLLYKYFTTENVRVKNFIILYVSFLTGAILGVIMPLWTTLTILIGISLWDLFAVLYKKGPIKQMIDLASNEQQLDEDIKQKLESGEVEYDTSKLEIGIGDLAFYSMLTSVALIITGNLIIMVLVAIAIIIGTGITIQGLKRNKILPGLPISIFLGIATMLISWGIATFLV